MSRLLFTLFVVYKTAALYLFALLLIYIGWVYSAPGYTGQPLLLLGVALLILAVVLTIRTIYKGVRASAPYGKLRMFVTAGCLIILTLLSIFAMFFWTNDLSNKGVSFEHEALTKVKTGYLDVQSITLVRPLESDQADVIFTLSVLQEGDYTLKPQFEKPVDLFTLISPPLNPVRDSYPRTFYAAQGQIRVRGQIDVSDFRPMVFEPNLTLNSLSIYRSNPDGRRLGLPRNQLVYERKYPLSWMGVTSSTTDYNQSVSAEQLAKTTPITVGPEARTIPPSESEGAWLVRLCENLRKMKNKRTFERVRFNQRTIWVSTFLWTVPEVGLAGIVLDAPETYFRELSLKSNSGVAHPVHSVISPRCASRARVVTFPLSSEVGSSLLLRFLPRGAMMVNVAAF